jgi:hypothetical protein
MTMRKDPMSAAAEAVNAIERICRGQAPADGAAADALNVEGQALMCTVGRMDIYPNQVGAGCTSPWKNNIRVWSHSLWVLLLVSAC